MTIRSKRVRSFAGVCLAALFVACGGGGRPAESPEDPPPLDDEPSETSAPASSPKVQQGIDAIQAGDFDKAKAVLTEAQSENPNDPQASFYLGVAQEGAGDVEAAVASYRKAIGLEPKLVEARANLSAIQLDGGDATGALETAEAGLKVDPRHAPLLINRAMALASLEKYPEAAAAFEKAVAATPKSVELRFQYAEVLALAGERDKALAELETVSGDDRVEILASAARLFGRLKAFDRCVAALDRAIQKKDAPELRVQRGLCRHEAKDDAGAKSDYEKAIQLDEKFAAAHFYLGQHFKAAGDKKGAKKELARAAELDPAGGVGKAAKKALDTL